MWLEFRRVLFRSVVICPKFSNFQNGRNANFVSKSLTSPINFLKSSQQSSISPPLSLPNSIPIQSNGTESKVESANLATYSTFKNWSKQSFTALKCLRANVVNPLNKSKCESALIFFDDGSTSSYITNALAEKLNLQSFGTEPLVLQKIGRASCRERVYFSVVAL